MGGSLSLPPYYLFNGFSSGAAIATPDLGGPGGKRRKSIRLSDLDARERLEASIHIRPFDPLEQAAYEIAISDDEDEEDDKLLLLACLRILH